MNVIHICRGNEYHTVLFVSNKQSFQCIEQNTIDSTVGVIADPNKRKEFYCLHYQKNDWYSCVHASSLPFVSLLVHCPVGAKAKVRVLNSSRTSCVEILFIEEEEAILFLSCGALS